MKRLIITAVVTGLIGGSAFAQTNVVSSANVVGYNQITIPSNQYMLVSLGFENAQNAVSNVFDALPVSSKVYLWDTATQNYITITRNAANRGGWGVAGSNKVTLGKGAFVTLPANIQTNMFFSGDVPTAETTSVFKVNGYAIVAYPYPVDTAFTNTSLAKNAAIGDKVSFWSNGWVSYSKNADNRGGWGGATNAVIKVGQAFFYKALTNAAVNEVKPYTLN